MANPTQRFLLFTGLLLIMACSVQPPPTPPTDPAPIPPSDTLAQPGSAPILRIEPGMHFAPIRRIDVDAAERFVVSASDDKTARVWDLHTGQLMQILRPPIGDGNEGTLNAVAISPDGEWVAASGWTRKTGLKEAIYIFQRHSDKLLRKLPIFKPSPRTAVEFIPKTHQSLPDKRLISMRSQRAKTATT